MTVHSVALERAWDGAREDGPGKTLGVTDGAVQKNFPTCRSPA